MLIKRPLRLGTQTEFVELDILSSSDFKTCGTSAFEFSAEVYIWDNQSSLMILCSIEK